MKQLYLKCLFLGFFSLVCSKASAYDCKVDGLYYNLNEAEKTASVTHFREKNIIYLSDDERYYELQGSITIPSTFTYNGIVYNVTSIGNSAFSNCRGLTSITIPNNVTSIGDGAFNWCSSLESIVVASNNKVYDSRNNCNAIIETASNALIAGCKNTIIPNNVTSIGNTAFDGCFDLTSVVIPSGVTSIGDEAFSGCTGLTSINIPNSVKSIGYGAFAGCNGLTSVSIGNSVTSIGEYAFSGCSGLTKVIVKDIAAWCSISFVGLYTNPLYFAHHIYSDEKTEITKLTIPNGVTGIGSKAFDYCTELTSIEIPSSVTSIGDHAFSGCTGLTSVEIPNSVTSIGFQAFWGCSGLTKVIAKDIEAWCNINFGSSEANPLNCAHHLYSDEKTEITELTIPSSVTNINSYVFSGCSGLTSLTISNTVTSIGKGAFYGCSGLTSVTIPNSVTNIGDYAFMGCSGLTSIQIPSGVTNIGDHAFSECSGLTSIQIPSGVTSIGKRAFYNCSGLTSVTVEMTTPFTFGSLAFYNISNACKLYVPAKTKSSYIEKGWTTDVFKGGVYEKDTFTYMYDGKTLTYKITNNTYRYVQVGDGTNAAIDTSESGAVNIPNSITYLGQTYTVVGIASNAFYNCINLTIVIIPNSVTTIGNYAFYNCKCCVTCNRLTPSTAYDNTFNTNMTALVPFASVSTYKQKTGWKKMSINSLCKSVETTQTSITLCLSNLISNVKAVLNGVTYYSQNDSIKITGLDPSTSYTISLSGVHENLQWDDQISVTTKNISMDIQLVKRTNLTLTLKGFVSDLGDAVITSSGFSGYEGQNDIYIDGLRPGYSYNYTYYVVTPSGKKISTSKSFQTVPVTLNVSAKTGSSSAQLTGTYYVIDAIVTNYRFQGYPDKQNTIKLTGLDPNTSYSQEFVVTIKDGGPEGIGKEFKSITFKTEQLTLTTSHPKVISAGNVIVAAESNLDDEETNVGFEWRRIDYTSEFPSYTGTAYLYNGTMEGYIRSLYTEKLWKYRPYYTSNAGNTYYGEWVGIDPTNTSYFEPTVHTYANVSVNGNSAEVKGYVQRGTDNVVSKGFAYWKQSQGVKAREAMAAPSMISSMPSNAKTIEVSGSQQVMTASLSNLEYETTYCYVAFVRTSEGDTFYGEEMTFTSGESPYTLGDVNGDKKIDISDVVAMVNHILGNTLSTSFKPQAADINKDSNIDISDVVSLVNMILGQ